MFEEMTVAKMYNLNETIAKDIFEGVTYPWEVLPKISDFIVKLGETLPADEYDKVGENVWIAKSAKVFESAYIHGPAIIGKDAEVRHCAFIRGNAIVGEGAVVGNLRMLYCSIKYRFHITTMLEIPYLDTKHIWEQDLSLPM